MKQQTSCGEEDQPGDDMAVCNFLRSYLASGVMLSVMLTRLFVLGQPCPPSPDAGCRLRRSHLARSSCCCNGDGGDHRALARWFMFENFWHLATVYLMYANNVEKVYMPALCFCWASHSLPCLGQGCRLGGELTVLRSYMVVVTLGFGYNLSSDRASGRR